MFYGILCPVEHEKPALVPWFDGGLGDVPGREMIVKIGDIHARNIATLARKSNLWYIAATFMKAAIHPKYTTDAKISCACGATYVVGSTMPEISIELCSACHPFYTGKQKLIDTARRVEKFQEKSAAMASKAGSALGKKAKAEKRATQKAAKKAQKTPTQLSEV